ncbi:hypothetical protein C8034_v011203 [Colletotrichum sidae]|uniref:Fungal N-terminal domain-containing protein n=1 Tax=Colletotrichum sidae TaxID=1347389 RepID=A0A4R8TIF1_9PEZI|nr:hypothetical protein C8034_v011203 [Colletotrichum sidae]
MEVSFGVIALTGQIVNTSLRLKRVIDSFNSAEDAFVNLRFKLECTAQTCGAARQIIEDEEESSDAPPSLLRKQGPVVLAEIDKSLRKLEELLPESDIKGKKPRRARQGIHFLLKSDTMATLSRHLDEEVFLLTTMLTLTVW